LGEPGTRAQQTLKKARRDGGIRADEEDEAGPVARLGQRGGDPAGVLERADVGKEARSADMVEDGARGLRQGERRTGAGRIRSEPTEKRQPACREEVRCTGDGGIEVGGLTLDLGRARGGRQGEGWLADAAAVRDDAQLRTFGLDLQIVAGKRAEGADDLVVAAGFRHDGSCDGSLVDCAPSYASAPLVLRQTCRDTPGVALRLHACP
jgi:hypothetical protein